MPVDERFTFRAYQAGDERAILDLFARSFPHAPRRSEHFRWKYLENPYGNAHISLAFDSDASLSGHYAGYPIAFWRNGESVVAHQIGDTMTDPAVRHVGRGPTSVISRTATHFFDTFCAEKVAFNYGFNVSNIQRLSVRFLRSFVVEPVTYRRRDLLAAPMPPLPRMTRWLRGLQLELVTRVDDEWDALFDRVASSYRFLSRRDARYVSWRYLEHPDIRYVIVAIRRWRRLVGWVVFRIDGDRFLWGDALFDPEVPAAVDAAVRHLAGAYPVKSIEGWFPPRPAWFAAALDKLGLVITPEPQGLSLMCTPFEWPDAVDRMRQDLYFTWGDSDLF